MVKYLTLFFLSFCGSLAVTPWVRLLALRLGAIDRPSARKIHREPIPRLGGLAVFGSFVASLLVAYQLGGRSAWLIPLEVGALLPILSGALIMFTVGVWDDIRPLSAGTKFLWQAVAAGIAIWLGVRIEQLSFLGTGALELGVLAVPLTFLWIVGITNAFNLIDGLDGLATGLASIAAGTCAAIFLLRGDAQDAMLLVMLLGALMGFLRYNFHPARIFLGDSGSLTVGNLLAVTAITGSQKGATALAVVVPLLVFGLPILDTLLSMARRFVGGLRIVRPYTVPIRQRLLAAKRMFEADQAHLHHRLLAIGLSHRHAVLAMYGLALALSCMALLSVFAQYRNAGIILVTVGLATYIGIHKLGYEEITFLRAGTALRWYEQLSCNRLFFVGFVDVLFITVAYWLSFVLKYDVRWPPDVKTWYLGAFPLILLVQLGMFWVFGLYRGVWRAAGIGDLLRILVAVGTGVALSYTVVLVSVPPSGVFPFFCIDLLVLGALAGGARCSYRVLDYLHQRERSSGGGALIYGAGRCGQLVLRELLQNPQLGLRPIGFVDDDPRLRHRLVHRLRVVGSASELAALFDRWPVACLVIASDKIPPARLRQVLSICSAHQVPVMRAQFTLEPIGLNGNGSELSPPVKAHHHAISPQAVDRHP